MSMDDRVAIRAKFERFPAAVKGAFLVRGSDGLPHQVRLADAHAAELGGGDSQPVVVESVVLEVSPTQETFVPFEISTIDMPAGWYQLECDVVVDGDATSVRPGDRFSMSWPRAALRRGTVPIGAKVAEVSFESLECLGDSIRVSFAADAAPDVSLSVDGRPHTILEVEFDATSGRGRVIGYPVLRANQRLSIAVGADAPVEVALP
jgi:hypothetical protein